MTFILPLKDSLYAPTVTPDENTRPAGSLFYYGTNAAMIFQGGVSLFRGARNFFSLEGVSQIRPNGSVNTLLDGGLLGQNAKTLVVTESHLKDLKLAFRTFGDKRNLFSSNYWKHVLPHRHIYKLPSAP
jgi:hypothetical protein